MSGKRMCQSYEIIDSRRVGNTEVVLGYSPTEVSPYVTWKCYAYDNFQGYNYALDREKTEQTCFETAINCDRESVYADMMDTKRRWGKEGRKRKGYHIIQSFAPGEVTPDQAHAVGVEFARRLLGDRYEVIVSTHLNKAHLHSHIVFNSISFVDGAMYRDQLKDYYGGDGVGIRGTSDAICREHGLSIIEPSEPLGGPVSRAEWEAARQGKATRPHRGRHPQGPGGGGSPAPRPCKEAYL